MIVPFSIVLVAVLAAGGVLMWSLDRAVASERFRAHRVHDPARNRPTKEEIRANARRNGFWSVGFLAVVAVLGADLLVHGEAVGWATVLGEVVAALLLYDMLYYFLHATLHRPFWMQRVHGVHHRILSPSAIESVFLSPIENLAGLGTLVISVAIVGPVSLVSFGIIFFVHESLNLIVHCGLSFDQPWLSPLEFLARNHDVHHGKQANRNFATLTPLWDHLMGTYGAPNR